MEYYDTDSIYRDVINRYADTLKVTAPTAKERIRTKLYLNSVYGKMVSCIHFTGGREKNMNKDYIVIHNKYDESNIGVGIIFKSKISSIIKNIDGKAIILLDSGYNEWCTESYEDIVKQLI